jgi:sugar lactone lactonase YvrE
MKGKKHVRTIMKFIYSALAIVVVAMGAVTANGALGDLFASINGTGENGGGSIFQYTPDGLQSTFASGLSSPRGVAFDSVGNLFVANNFFDGNPAFQATILKVTPGGTQSTFASFSPAFYLQALAIDSSHNIFVMAVDSSDPTLASTIYKFTPGGAGSTFGSIPGQGFGLAFDSIGNLFAADAWFRTIYKFDPNGTRSVFVDSSAFTPGFGPVGLAFDRFGNLFVSVESGIPPVQNGDSILKFTPEGVGSPFATGLNYPRGLAFDRSGNLFVAEVNEFGPGDVLKFTPDGMMTVFAVVPGEVNSGPEFLAFQLLPTPRPRPSPHPRPTSQF